VTEERINKLLNVKYILISISDFRRLISNLKTQAATQLFNVMNFFMFYIYFHTNVSIIKKKVKVIPLQARCGPEGG